MKNLHYIYILKCSDETLYCGYTIDITRRVEEHNHSPKGAKYTKGRRPVKLIYSEEFENKGDALRREIEIKKMGRREKLKVILPTPVDTVM